MSYIDFLPEVCSSYCINDKYRVSHPVVDLGWNYFDFGAAAQLLLPNSNQLTQNWADCGSRK